MDGNRKKINVNSAIELNPTELYSWRDCAFKDFHDEFVVKFYYSSVINSIDQAKALLIDSNKLQSLVNTILYSKINVQTIEVKDIISFILFFNNFDSK